MQDVRQRIPWYVVQVSTGYEQQACELISQAAGDDILAECFVPRFRTGKKVREGGYQPTVEVLFPGYVIAVTNHIEELEGALKRIPKLTKILGNNDVFIPLHPDEIAWIDARAPEDNRIIDMSEGYIEKGVLHITSGPLVGREVDVVKVNHRKKIAYVNMNMFGRTKTVSLGLRITRKR